MTSPEVRERLAEALLLDLVGPSPGHRLANEMLPQRWRPSVWYLTGFLIPSGAPPEDAADLDEDDDMGETPASPGLSEESSEDRRAAKKGFFPSSMGLSFLVEAKASALEVVVSWGDYRRADGPEKQEVWQRFPRRATVPVPLGEGQTATDHEVPDSHGLRLHVVERAVDAAQFLGGIPEGTRAMSVFLVNDRRPGQPDHRDRDTTYAFQPEVAVKCDRPFVARPNPRGFSAEDWDERVADLHYADTRSYATGHGVSGEWEIDADGTCRRVRTAWMPSAEVEVVETQDVRGAELGMEALGALRNGAAAQVALAPIAAEYRAWIAAQRDSLAALPGRRRKTAEKLLRQAESVADRIERGIQVLSQDEDVLDAFRVANRSVARALRQRLEDDANPEGPRWRSFQLAFALLNLPGLADPADPDRRIVDLLFFPTGGGKTEAYLGLAATAMVLRRLRNREPADGHGGAGVCVVMRYTLRLLTFDQLTRAAGLVCALELEREGNTDRYGQWPFEIGIWVGKAATPNVMGRKGKASSGSARSKTLRYKENPRGRPAPIPLEDCPWCGKRFQPDVFDLLPDSDNPRDLRIVCTNFDCDFSGNRPLPIVAVDEPLYRRLPAFLVATVDKFAALPWTGPCGLLLGGADRADEHGFYGPAEPARGRSLPTPVPPPDLIVQDELHLISGPLGTMAGLYETAIEALCTANAETDSHGSPKIVASTATVRQAANQVQALFARPETQVFPPHGPSRRDSFFARTVPRDERSARRYVGIAAQGRNPKVVMRRVVLALMGAAEKAYRECGGPRNQPNPADPYMTLVGYFNSLRELGGARRILEEEVGNTLKRIGDRRRVGEAQGLFRSRTKFREVMELTSRVPTNKVAQARHRLDCPFGPPAGPGSAPVDCAIATNMISVGLDINRLGLMVVQGQPKTSAEYIQATSRVGRDPSRPGLVVTLLGMYRPRDRSHYERFRSYHETFYRSVEVTSVTPFSARALDRGLAGALVGLARHADRLLTPASGAGRIGDARAELERRLLTVFRQRVENQPIADDEGRELVRSVHNRVVDLLDSWVAVADDYQHTGGGIQYQKYEQPPLPPLLREMLDTDFESERHRQFRANRSLRDVEPDVAVSLKEPGARRVKRPRSASKAHGHVRRGPVVSTWGPGALIDLPHHSAIMGGVETWPGEGDLQEVLEPRLTAKLKHMTDVHAPRLYAPPAADNGFRGSGPKIGARRFPEWFVVQESRTGDRRLVHRKHLDEKRKFDGRPVVATRFVRACPRGHIDDLDWRRLVHPDDDDPCLRGRPRQLRLEERGTSGDLSDLVVRCECGKSRRLLDARNPDLNALGKCTGARPWLGSDASEPCDQPARLLVRTATNAYFPQIVSVLSLPDPGTAVRRAVLEIWDDLRIVDDAGELATLKKKVKVTQVLEPFSDEQVLGAIGDVKVGANADRPVKQVELDAILAAPEGFRDDPPFDPDFHARRLPDRLWRRPGHSNGVAAVVQLHRLREVLALVGFTRFEAVTPDIHGELETDVMRADLARDPSWFPAVENRGEGVFVQLDADAVAAWQERPAVQKRVRQLADGHERWKAIRKTDRAFPGGPYVLLHTLSHLLIHSLAIRCGYPTSAIRERVYADYDTKRFGILLYTGSPDAEGTLGGLVQQARSIEDHLEHARETGALCSNDPVCAQHLPGTDDMEDRPLHGAACHGCALIAETSCEMRNDCLDRALVVPVLGHPDAAFFGRVSG